MPRTTSKRHETKRLDGLIALSLERFRAAIERLSPDEMAALESRIGMLTVKNRWALGGHGMERHRAQGELGLLARRLTELHREARLRSRATSFQLRLIEFEPLLHDLTRPEPVDQAA